MEKKSSTEPPEEIEITEIQITKKEYESVNKAFTDLALPLSIHIGFRTKMRKEGRNIIEKDGVTYLFCCC